MRFPLTFIVGLLLASADGVFGGSRFWEAKAPNKRTNSNPDYAANGTPNATSRLVKRALSIDPTNSAVSRIWPNKKIRYCFEDRDENTNVIIRGLWKQAQDLWAPLLRHGFSYEEVSDSVCDSQRSTVLRIHYNNNGRFMSTIGIPPIDEADPASLGPYSHLSDLEGVGQDDVAANVAHELGHVWGLYHEHQNPNYWRVSTADLLTPEWSIVFSSNTRFQTSSFKCQNLKDYDSAHEAVRAKIARAIEEGDKTLQGQLENDLRLLCFWVSAAYKHGFSAADWLPYPNTSGMNNDDPFDPDSIMLYPSRAGGKGTGGDDRAPILVYDNGDLIPNRLAPSGMDIDRLITTYGTPASSTTGEPHTSKSSKFRSGFKKSRSMIFRAGDTSAGIC